MINTVQEIMGYGEIVAGTGFALVFIYYVVRGGFGVIKMGKTKGVLGRKLKPSRNSQKYRFRG